MGVFQSVEKPINVENDTVIVEKPVETVETVEKPVETVEKPVENVENRLQIPEIPQIPEIQKIPKIPEIIKKEPSDSEKKHIIRKIIQVAMECLRRYGVQMCGCFYIQ